MTEAFYAINRSVDDATEFFGRQTEIAWLTEQLDRGERLLAISGPHLIGKSSLLRQLVHRLPTPYLVVYVDISRADDGDSGSFLLQIARQVAHAVRERTDIPVELPEAKLFAEHDLQAWQTYLDALTAQLDRRHLVLLLDHADLSSPERLYGSLHACLSTILATENQDRLTESMTRAATLMDQAAVVPHTIMLGPLDNKAAEALVRALVTIKTQIDPWAVRRILEITSHHPYYIHLFCRVLLECCAHRSLLTPTDVEEALRFMLDMPIPEFTAIWESLSPHEQYVLSAFGALRGTGGIATQYDIQKYCAQQKHAFPRGDIVASLDSSVQRGILEKLGTSSYRFSIELLRLWLHRHRPPHQVWRTIRSRGVFHLTGLGRALSRQWRLWMSLMVIVLVVAIVLLQPTLSRTKVVPAATFARTMVAANLFTPTPTPLAIAANTPVPTPAVVLPGYDLVYMSRAEIDAPWQIYVMNSRTGKRLRWTQTDSNERTPKWSPDGKRLVFASDRDGNREVYVMDLQNALQGAEDAHLVNLTQDKAPDWQPAWSPDGERVAFSSYRDGNWEIYIVDVDGEHLTRLTEHPDNDFSPAWSPDGQRLVFASRRHGNADLFVMDIDTGEHTKLTESELDEFDPAWSPNGEWIAFVTRIGDQSDVFSMRSDGSDAVNLTDSLYANDFQPAWTPDSEWLVFVSDTFAEGDHELYRMRRDGSDTNKLTDDDSDNLAPNWRSGDQ